MGMRQISRQEQGRLVFVREVDVDGGDTRRVQRTTAGATVPQLGNGGIARQERGARWKSARGGGRRAGRAPHIGMRWGSDVWLALTALQGLPWPPEHGDSQGGGGVGKEGEGEGVAAPGVQRCWPAAAVAR